ncbi:MAG: hypothetical protein DIU73_008620 [Actinomycetes bacterium]|nr:MAG: hypothetical protein DIU73_01000 [Actinomycetota bacterium]
MSMKRLVPLALVSGSLLVVAGCTTPAADPSPSPTVTASPVVTESPSPEPSPEPTSDAVELDCPTWDDGLDESGLAPIAANRYAGICAGMSFEEASGTYAGPPLTGHEFCPWLAPIVAIDDPGLYVDAVSRPDAPGAEIFLFRMAWYGDLAAASSFEVPRNAEGISVGSTTAEVLAAYPGATQVSVDDMALGPREQIVVPVTDEYTYVFDVTDGRVSFMYWGEGISSGATAELCAL